MYVCCNKVQVCIANCRAPRYALHCLHTCYSLGGSVEPPIGHSPSGQTLYAYLRFRRLFRIATSGQPRRWTCFNSFFPASFLSLIINIAAGTCVIRLQLNVSNVAFHDIFLHSCHLQAHAFRRHVSAAGYKRTWTRTASTGMAHYTHLRKCPHKHALTHTQIDVARNWVRCCAATLSVLHGFELT